MLFELFFLDEKYMFSQYTLEINRTSEFELDNNTFVLLYLFYIVNKILTNFR